MENPIITIAIAENHLLLRTALQVVLEAMGFKVILTAQNGEQLLEELKNAKQLPSLCILDINMPVLDGYETARQLKRLYPFLKILAMTVFDNDKKKQAILNAGADDFIVKSDPIEKWEITILRCCALSNTKNVVHAD